MGVIELAGDAQKWEKPLKYLTVFMSFICLGTPGVLFVVQTGFRWFPVTDTSVKYEIMLSVVFVVQGLCLLKYALTDVSGGKSLIGMSIYATIFHAISMIPMVSVLSARS
uniref:Uncharacterized protein n=1 Tax=Haptolina brevifila TaxID=156173 RepID=A0A7S2JIX0_9EUKA